MLSFLKDKFSGASKRLSGRTDLLEAVCASAALVAAADGSIDDDEIVATSRAVAANKVLKDAFDTRTIEATIDTMLKRAEGGRVGQAGLMKEIAEASSNHEDAELIMFTALDIAEADGEISPEETAMMEKIASKLGLKLSDFI